MKNILTEALVNSATNASFIFSYTNSAKLRTERNARQIYINFQLYVKYLQFMYNVHNM